MFPSLGLRGRDPGSVEDFPISLVKGRSNMVLTSLIVGELWGPCGEYLERERRDDGRDKGVQMDEYDVYPLLVMLYEVTDSHVCRRKSKCGFSFYVVLLFIAICKQCF